MSKLAIAVAGPPTWNAMRLVDDYACYRRLLKAHLLNPFNASCSKLLLFEWSSAMLV